MAGNLLAEQRGGVKTPVLWLFCTKSRAEDGSCTVREADPTLNSELLTSLLKPSYAMATGNNQDELNNKRRKRDTSFLYQSEAGRDLPEDERKQKLVSFKHYFNVM